MQQLLKGSYDLKKNRIIATTNSVDRDGEVVDPRGVRNLDSYLSANPVVLWQHRHNEAPIGKASGGRVFDDRIELDVEWAPTSMGQEVKSLYEGGFMNSFSIGFVPQKSENVNGQFTWTEWELLEVSAVSIPANPMANMIRSAERAGLSLPTLKSYTEPGFADPDRTGGEPTKKENTMEYQDTIEKAKQELREEIRKEDLKEAERKELIELREKYVDLSQRMAVEPDEPDAMNIRGRGGENYRGVNLGHAQKKFVELQEKRGNPKAVELAKGDTTKDVLKAFVDLQEQAKANSGPVNLKDMTNTDANGGYLNPIVTHDLMNYARLRSVALNRANVVDMQSDYEKVPVENAKVNLTYTGEATEAAETSATFTQVELTAKDLDGYADVAMHLEMDSRTPIAAVLLDQFTEAYAQRVDSAVFAGTGDPVSGLFLSYGRSEVFDTGSSSFSEILVGNLISTIGKLEKPRRNGAIWVGGRETLWQHLMTLKDGNDNPYLVRDLADQAAWRLLGYPLEETEYAPDDAASTAMLIFGNLEGMLIGNRLGNLTLFRDPYSLSAQHYVRYVFWTRIAYANALPNNIVAIKTAA